MHRIYSACLQKALVFNIPVKLWLARGDAHYPHEIPLFVPHPRSRVKVYVSTFYQWIGSEADIVFCTWDKKCVCVSLDQMAYK